MKILVVEDEKALRGLIVEALEREHFVVEEAADYSQALDKMEVYDYDCILLDLTLPGGDGLQLLNKLKHVQKKEGVLILSARDSVEDKVTGLALGADDYLAKPFHMVELLARVKSILRRKRFDGQQITYLANIGIDFEQRIVWVNEEPLALNRKEFDILSFFIANKNRLVTKNALAEHVWGDHIDEADSYEFVYSQIKNLRKKLKDADCEIEIQAVYGIGYKLVCE